MTRIITNFDRLVVLSRLTNLTTDCADNTDWEHTEHISVMLPLWPTSV